MEEKINMDDVMHLEQGDPGGMLAAVESFPEHCAEGLRLGRELERIPPSEGIEGVAFVGMGGSGIGGAILRVLLEEAAGVPISIHRSYRLPSMLGEGTLTFVVSYSGNTEETLAAFDDAVYLGCRVVAVTSGGALFEKARGRRFPVVQVPGGMQPRAALGYLTFPAAAVMERMNLVRGFMKVVYEALEHLKKRRNDWGRLAPEEKNFAKQLARRLENRIPVVYGTEGIMEVAAYRWKCQFNENSKAPSFHGVLPEMDHNEIVGWSKSNEFTRGMEAVFLVDGDEDPRVLRRVEITSEIIGETAGGVTVIHVDGRTRTEKLLSAVYLGDFVSTYLALLRGVDPTPVESIVRLKKRMAEEKEAAEGK
jgi:glucose/mannose-6-phosphate isomerase